MYELACGRCVGNAAVAGTDGFACVFGTVPEAGNLASSIFERCRIAPAPIGAGVEVVELVWMGVLEEVVDAGRGGVAVAVEVVVVVEVDAGADADEVTGGNDGRYAYGQFSSNSDDPWNGTGGVGELVGAPAEDEDGTSKE